MKRRVVTTGDSANAMVIKNTAIRHRNISPRRVARNFGGIKIIMPVVKPSLDSSLITEAVRFVISNDEKRVRR